MISVVVSCSGRKSLSIPKTNRVGTIRGANGPRAETWIRRISTRPGVRPAMDLYQGEHWSVCRELANSDTVRLFVASAGYGLIRPNSLLAPYSATFGDNDPDSVVSESAASPSIQRQLWWDALQRWDGPDHDRATLSKLARRGPVVLAMSLPYASALENEILSTEQRFPGRQMIVSTGGVPLSLQPLQLPGDGRLQNVLGGSLQALNVRTAKSVVLSVPEASLDQASAAAHLNSLLRSAGELVQFRRKKLDDAEVKNFIRSALRSNASAACSPTHRSLRDHDMACEQSRFKRLFEEVRLSV